MFIQIISIVVLFVGSLEALSKPAVTSSQLHSFSENGDDLVVDSAKEISSQKVLFAKTGIVVVPTPKIPSDYFLDTLVAVMMSGLSNNARKKLTRLQFVIADDSISRKGVEAYYSYDQKALIIGKTGYAASSNSKYQLAHTWSVIAHEIGHAYVMSNLSAERLAFLARKFGPWRLNDPGLGGDLFSPVFFRPHLLFGAPAGVINELDNSPSRYALQNVHEWFAECFSTMVKEKLRRQGLLPDIRSPSDVTARPLSAALQAWFYDNVTH